MSAESVASCIPEGKYHYSESNRLSFLCNYSDVLRRHEKSHQNLSPKSHASGPATSFPGNDSMLFTTSSQAEPGPKPVGTVDQPLWQPHATAQTPNLSRSDVQHPPGMALHDTMPHDDSSWFLGADLDVDALDFSLSSAIFEWAQLPSTIPYAGSTSNNFDLAGPITAPTSVLEPSSSHRPNAVKKKWFTYLSPSEESRSTQPTATDHKGAIALGNVNADENYRAGLSRQLQPRMHDEALPSAEHLNLFARLFFSRFHSLLPIIHAPTFRPTPENSLLFLSICSIGSLFVGSSHAVVQGTRIFERLNKAILASWEIILSHSRPGALSMVQAAIMGQTFAILSGRPRDLVMADVLHGTVISWARESNKHSHVNLSDTKQLNLDHDAPDLEEQWQTWIEVEQRGRVEVALNIHDAELAGLLHHDPARKHRFAQYPHLESDALFMAPTATKWASIYKQPPSTQTFILAMDNTFHNAGGRSRFAAYSVLESINACLLESRHSATFNTQESARISELLIHWWRTHKVYLQDDEDPFSLPVLWHTTYMCLYVDMDQLEQAIGRCGSSDANRALDKVQKWACSLDASKCLVHALLIQRYMEQMRVSAEPAIHLPRALFSAALAWICFNRIGHQQGINLKALDAPEIQLLGSDTALLEAEGQAFGDSAFADVNHLHRLIDLLHRVGRWAISETFASVLCATLEDGKME